MRLALPLLFCLWVFASRAHAADALSPARAEVQRTQEAQRERLLQQRALAGRIGVLSEEIATLKGRRGRADAARLDAALKESQALSATLGDVTRALATGERALTDARTALLTGVGEGLVQLRAQYDRTQDRSARARLLEQMRALRNESVRVRSQLPPALMPTLPAEVARGDEPEDLLAQADVLRDHADRLKKRLAELRTQLKQARAEAELSRRMDDFMGENSLFDEQDRRSPTGGLQASNAGSPGASDAQAPEGGPSTAPPPQEYVLLSLNQGQGSGFATTSLAGRAGATSATLDAHAGLEQLEQLEAQLEARAREYAERAAALERRAQGR